MRWLHAAPPPGPRFSVRDPVVVTGPGPHRDKEGLVVEVIQHSGDFVYRYRVQFSTGTSEIFFGFELKLIEASSAAS